MSKLLHAPRMSSIHLRTFSPALSRTSFPLHLSPSLSPLFFHCRLSSFFSLAPPSPPLPPSRLSLSSSHRDLSVRAFDSSSETKNEEAASSQEEEGQPNAETATASDGDNGSLRKFNDDEYPSGEFEFQEIRGWKKLSIKLRMLFAFPWERVRKGSVLTMKLRGQASFLGGVFEKVGIEPQVERIGKYKSAGDQLVRKTMSEENCEMLTALLNNIYGNWLDKISLTKGKKKEDIEKFIDDGVYQVERLKEEGWINDIQYDDEVISMLKERLALQKDKNLPMVDYKKYSSVRKWTLGLSGGKEQIAIIRASGSISRVRSPFSIPSSGIIGEQLIEKIRSARESKRYKAVVIRIDSPGGDALASDLMWREIKLLAASKPVIASMADVAASGGYYMAMAAGCIVAENLTLTGSIGVVTGRFNLGNLYEKIGFNKEIISRGKYAELNAADQRPLRPHEAELFAKSAQNAYKQFRDKAAVSRSMPVDKMEEIAQGRVWTGKDAASRGLVDAIGGLSRAVAIAKQKANIPQDKQVTLVELSRPSPTLPEILSGIGSSIIGVDKTLKQLLESLTFSDGVQARMDGILIERLEGASFANPILTLIKDYLSSI